MEKNVATARGSAASVEVDTNTTSISRSYGFPDWLVDTSQVVGAAGTVIAIGLAGFALVRAETRLRAPRSSGPAAPGGGGPCSATIRPRCRRPPYYPLPRLADSYRPGDHAVVTLASCGFSGASSKSEGVKHMVDRTATASKGPDARSDRIVIALGAGRAALGVLLLARPRLLPTLLEVDSATSATMAWALQMLGGREIALGLGSVVASRAEPTSAKRTWLAASMLSDTTDSIAIAAAMATGTLARRPATLVAASAAALAAAEAILLIRKSGRDG